MFVSRFPQNGTQSLKGQLRSGLGACIRPDEGEFIRNQFKMSVCDCSRVSLECLSIIST